MVNVSNPERVARSIVGTSLFVAGVMILAAGVPLYMRLGALLLLNAGLNLAVTGVMGYCPLNAQSGRSLSRPTEAQAAHPGGSAQTRRSKKRNLLFVDDPSRPGAATTRSGIGWEGPSTLSTTSCRRRH